jgi:hypothetical protein
VPKVRTTIQVRAIDALTEFGDDKCDDRRPEDAQGSETAGEPASRPPFPRLSASARRAQDHAEAVGHDADDVALANFDQPADPGASRCSTIATCAARPVGCGHGGDRHDRGAGYGMRSSSGSTPVQVTRHRPGVVPRVLMRPVASRIARPSAAARSIGSLPSRSGVHRTAVANGTQSSSVMLEPARIVRRTR